MIASTIVSVKLDVLKLVPKVRINKISNIPALIQKMA